MTNLTQISFDVIKAIATSEHVPDLFTGQETHEPALKLVCELAKVTSNADYVTDIIASTLPDNYNGNTISEIPKMFEWALESPEHNEVVKNP